MRLAALVLVLAGCAEAPVEILPAAPEALQQPAELVGRWEGFRPQGLEDETWLLRADGVAELVEHDYFGARTDELCRWGVRRERFELDCPHFQERAPFRVDGVELSFAPLRRATPAEREAEERDEESRGRHLLGLWISEEEVRRDSAFEPDQWFVGERSMVRLFDDYTLRTQVVSHSGGCVTRISVSPKARCAIAEDTLVCTSYDDRDPEHDGEEVLSAVIDPESGEPAFDGRTISHHRWRRIVTVE